jgi:hypothetical protein
LEWVPGWVGDGWVGGGGGGVSGWSHYSLLVKLLQFGLGWEGKSWESGWSSTRAPPIAYGMSWPLQQGLGGVEASPIGC